MSAVADFGIEYTNAVSTLAAADYVAHTRRIAAAEGDQRAELLGLLLGGFDESDARVTRLLKRAGYLDQRQSFCVVLVRSTDPLEMENPPRVQRIVDALKGAIDSSPIRLLTGVRQHLVTAVLADNRRQSGWTAPAGSLAERVQPLLLRLGPAVLIGVSGDQPSTSFIPRGLREATLALDLATVTERVVCYARLPLRKLLLARAEGAAPLVAPTWFDALADADGKSRGSLLQTLRALADADLNVQQAARALALHPNTLYARMRRIGALTGHDASRFHDLTELLLAADCRVR
jgi:sugar diacid utilization regulator